MPRRAIKLASLTAGWHRKHPFSHGCRCRDLCYTPAPMETFLAAAIQMTSGSDLDANLARAATLTRRAAARGARLIALPEVFAWRGDRTEETRAACPIPGHVSEFLCALAAELHVVLVGGSFLEQAPGTPKAYNTSLLVGDDGTVIGTYRKLHLFDVDIPGQVSVRESDTRTPGSNVVAVPTPRGTIGLSICYDLRFPELYRALARAGATILAVPSAFTFVTGAAHWEPLLRARAIENQCYVLAPNQTGTSPHGFADYGNSMIVDPWGTVLARAADGERVILAEIDPAHVAQVRRAMPCHEHVRLRA
jgi:deaminated glutathione amidase